jgi:hypothetical protein
MVSHPARAMLVGRSMSTNDIHGIEPGWNVKTADGHDVGSVVETTGTYIAVKSGLLNAAHRYLPAATLAHVRPELGEIGIALTQAEVTDGDWSEPPLAPPRTEGAPLNADADEVDPLAAASSRGPEKPITF